MRLGGEQLEHLVNQFQQSDFIVDEDYRFDDIISRVYLADVRGIKFNGCHFINTSELLLSPLSLGIESEDGGFTVRSFCTDPLPTPPPVGYVCPEEYVDRSYFSGFYYAIRASHLVKPHTFRVSDTDFENNICGIQTLGINDFVVTCSSFLMGEQTGIFGNFGILINTGTGFRIQDNDFNGTTWIGPFTWGTFALNTGASENLIYANRFNVLTRANTANGTNRDGFNDYIRLVVGTLPSGTLSTAQSTTSPNSIFNVGTTVSTSAMRNQRSFAETGLPSPSNPISFSFDFYDDNAAASPYRSHSNLQDGTAPGSYGQLVAMALNNNQTSSANGGNYYMARILGYTPTDTGRSSGSFFKLNDLGAPLRSTGWQSLQAEITDLSFTFFVDGILSKTVAQTGTLRSYDHVRLGSGLSNAGVESYFDNVLVQVPEPTTAALAGIGICMLNGMRRSRK